MAYIVHSMMPPVLFESIVNPGTKYLISEEGWKEVPMETTFDDIVWFRKRYGQKKNPALELEMEYQVPGSKGKLYDVKYSDEKWSCSCEAFTFSGGRTHCKHIKQVLKDIEDGKYSC